MSDYYAPFPRQKDFHKSRAKYRLFGGAAGPGKTTALLWEAILQALDVSGSNTLLLRRTYPELESSLLAYFRRDVPRALYKNFNESKRIVTWHNGSTTRFGYCRTESDVFQYQGAEFLFIGIDELTHFTLQQWQFLTSRNRCPIEFYPDGNHKGKRIVPGMAGATNPGNIGHAWVKALWVDHKPAPGMENAERYDARDYDFISAHMADNPIYAHDANYHRTLEALPENLRRAFLDGDWDVFAGQYFDVFEIARHVVRPEEFRLEPWWPRWISIDWGFQHPSAVYWHVAIPGFNYSTGPYNHDPRHPASLYYSPEEACFGPRILTYRELVQPELSPRMLGQAILERTGRDRIAEVFLSPDAYSERTAEASIAEQLGEILAYGGLPQPVPAVNDRVGGWQLLYQLLEGDRWLIGENCRALIECLPTLTRDTTYVEDIRKREGDDPADSARYGLVSGLRIAFPHGLPAPPPSAHPGSFGPEQGPQREGRTPQSNFAGANRSGDSGSAPSTLHAGEPRYPDSSQSGDPSSPAAGSQPPAHPNAQHENAPAHASPNFYPASYNDAAWDRFAPPLDEYLARQISATDPTSRAIWLQKLQSDARRKSSSVPLPHRRR